MPAKFPAGRVSQAKVEYIATNLEKTDEELSEVLQINIATVAKHRKSVLTTHVANEVRKSRGKLTFALESRPYWKHLQLQFTESELELVLYDWGEIVAQFNEDISSTEEMAVLDLIKMNILIHRNLSEKAKGLKEIERFEKKLSQEFAKPNATQNDDLIMSLETTLIALRNSQRQATEEHVKLDKQKQTREKDLKITRDQRLKIVDDSKTQFKDLMAALEEEKVRRKMSLDMAIRKKVVEKSINELSEFHTYIDGDVDQPILTSQTLKDQE